MARGDEVIWAGDYRMSGLGGVDTYKSQLPGLVAVSVVYRFLLLLLLLPGVKPGFFPSSLSEMVDDLLVRKK